MTKVLITGGAGFIGSHIVDKFIEQNIECVVIDNLSSGSLDNLQNSNLIKFHNKDIVTDDYENIFATEKPDFVVHLAAQTSVFTSCSEPCYDANANIVASIKLLNLCKKYEVKKFITSSSAAVYGSPKYLPIDENHPTEPISFYGLSKLTMEKYIQLFGVPYVIFRFANVYGERQSSSKESGVISIFNDAMIKNEQINIFGDGEQIRDFVYVKDIANAVANTINAPISNEIINFSTNVGVTVNKMFNLMKELYCYKLEPKYLPEREGDIKDSILSNKKTSELIGLNSITSLEDGIKHLHDWSIEGVKLEKERA